MATLPLPLSLSLFLIHSLFLSLLDRLTASSLSPFLHAVCSSMLLAAFVSLPTHPFILTAPHLSHVQDHLQPTSSFAPPISRTPTPYLPSLSFNPLAPCNTRAHIDNRPLPSYRPGLLLHSPLPSHCSYNLRYLLISLTINSLYIVSPRLPHFYSPHPPYTLPHSACILRYFSLLPFLSSSQFQWSLFVVRMLPPPSYLLHHS